MKLISLKEDYAFKELFSYENVRKQFLSDVLGIPVEEMQEVRVLSPYLWKRFRRQKQGILDMALELTDGTRINIEMQVRRQKHWIKRKLFYLAKLYTDDLKIGQDYGRLHRCISISILDFNLTEGEEYHTEYRLRSKDGKELTDLLELHIIELRKQLMGTDAVNDWIRLFNAENEEDLKMILSKNDGMKEAMGAVKTMSLGKSLRYLYEQRLKAWRDRRAEDEYVFDEGVARGKAEGKAEAILQILGKYGSVPQDVSEKVMCQKDLDVLDAWLKTAVKAESIEAFQESALVESQDRITL